MDEKLLEPRFPDPPNSLFGAALFVIGLLALWLGELPYSMVGPVLSIGGAGWFVNALYPPHRSDHGDG